MTTTETHVVDATKTVYDRIKLLREDTNILALTLEDYCLDSFARKPLLGMDADGDTLALIQQFSKVKELLHYANLMKNKADSEIPHSPFSAHKSLDWLSNAMLLMHEFMRTISTDFQKLDLKKMEEMLRRFREREGG